MRRKLFGCALAGFAFMAFAGAAQANDACYTWDCGTNSPTCTFDASCSTVTAGTLWKYAWDFGDGTTLLTGSPNVSHTYSMAYPTVKLTLVFWNDPTVSETCWVVAWNAVSPQLPLSGTCY